MAVARLSAADFGEGAAVRRGTRHLRAAAAAPRSSAPTTTADAAGSDDGPTARRQRRGSAWRRLRVDLSRQSVGAGRRYLSVGRKSGGGQRRQRLLRGFRQQQNLQVGRGA